MGFSRQEFWSGLPCPPPGDLPDPEIKPEFLTSPALAGRFFTTSTTWEAHLKGGTFQTHLIKLYNSHQYENKAVYTVNLTWQSYSQQRLKLKMWIAPCGAKPIGLPWKSTNFGLKRWMTDFPGWCVTGYSSRAEVGMWRCEADTARQHHVDSRASFSGRSTFWWKLFRFPIRLSVGGDFCHQSKHESLFSCSFFPCFKRVWEVLHPRWLRAIHASGWSKMLRKMYMHPEFPAELSFTSNSESWWC